jgi:8-oxo-dGTP diphosphatase
MAAILPSVGVLALVARGDKVLLARRANPPDAGLWGFPGGRLESGETLAEAAERELLEETGVRARFAQPLEVLEMIRRDEQGALAFHYILVAMAGEWIEGEPQASTDILDAAWMTPKMIARLTCSSETGRLAAALLASATSRAS